MGSILSQDEYLYNEKWPKEAVGIVIEMLLGEALYGSCEYNVNKEAGIDATKMTLKREQGKMYSDEDVYEALSKLHERYTVWKMLTSDPQVYFNKWYKNVTATNRVWERLVKTDKWIKWYATDGKKSFDDLEVIFENLFKGKDDYVTLQQANFLSITL